MLRQRNTKIIATLGPATSSPSSIDNLYRSGVDIFRLNFSHGSHSEKRKLVYQIRQYEKRLDRPIAILGDLQGPKFRIGNFHKKQIFLKSGDKFTLDLNLSDGDENRVCLPHPEIFKSLKKNSTILIDDGKIQLKVFSVHSDKIQTEVAIGGKISNHKGVNIPNILIKTSPLTKKDILDLDLCVDLSLDYIALSFVQRPTDILKLRKIV